MKGNFLAIIILVLLLSGCECYPGGQLVLFRSDITEVKNLVFTQANLNESIGEAFDTWFESPIWRDSATYDKKGEALVTFTGKIKATGKKTRVNFLCGHNSEKGFRVCDFDTFFLDDKGEDFNSFKSLLNSIAGDLKNHK